MLRNRVTGRLRLACHRFRDAKPATMFTDPVQIRKLSTVRVEDRTSCRMILSAGLVLVAKVISVSWFLLI